MDNDNSQNSCQFKKMRFYFWKLVSWGIFLIWGGFLWLLALLILVALVAFQPIDFLFKSELLESTKNNLGIIGAWIAGTLYNLFGFSTWLLLILLMLAGWIYFRQNLINFLFIFFVGSLWFIIAVTTLLGLSDNFLSITKFNLPLGGSIGKIMANSLCDSLGLVRAKIIIYFFLAIGVALISWSIWPILRWLLNRYKHQKVVQSEGTSKIVSNIAKKIDNSAKLPIRELKIESQNKTKLLMSNKILSILKPDLNLLTKKSTLSHIKTCFSNFSSSNFAFNIPYSEENYVLPPLDILQLPYNNSYLPEQKNNLLFNSKLLERKLLDFGIRGEVVEILSGPVVTTYQFRPASGIKISKISSLIDDLAMNLKVESIRIGSFVSDKAVVSIEIPNVAREKVFLRELLCSSIFHNMHGPLTVALGKNILGQPVADDLTCMPHLLVAGATGSGKSMFINTLILSLLYRYSPDHVRLLMVDPKFIELSIYNGIPHLLYPVITSFQDTTAGLRWAIAEMKRRYESLAKFGVRNINSFNQRLRESKNINKKNASEVFDVNCSAKLNMLPYLVIIIDELADLMMVLSKEIEPLIIRLAQMARAAGIHLVLSTQRPSVDVITGLIKANFPARISFQVSSRIDSRTILDSRGAEQLLGSGDFLFLSPAKRSLKRMHAAFVSEREIEEVVDYVKKQTSPNYDKNIINFNSDFKINLDGQNESSDNLYADAVNLVLQVGSVSISFIQRKLRIGYNRAARMVEKMEMEGIIGPYDGSRPRKVLIKKKDNL